jgi:hypothetical protein
MIVASGALTPEVSGRISPLVKVLWHIATVRSTAAFRQDLEVEQTKSECRSEVAIDPQQPSPTLSHCDAAIASALPTISATIRARP